jgi:hypothetical protein
MIDVLNDSFSILNPGEIPQRPLTPNLELLNLDSPVIHIAGDDTLKEYIVIIKNYENLDNFCNDMESPEGTLHIPNRKVEVADLRPSSRSTHYMLTSTEANLLLQDPRVETVSLPFYDKGDEIKPMVQYSNKWNKSGNVSTDSKNWGLYRVYTGNTVSNWGYDGTGNTSGNVNITNSGRNVDVVICDGHINPNHPEFAVNPDGTGGSRVIQYNWLQHNPAVTGGAAGTYVYDFLAGGEVNNNHGTHVAGTACGNTQGWAIDCNIYNIYPYPSGSVQADTTINWTYYVLDYIRQFHINKPINPATNRKNPTIVNCSWGATSTANLLLTGNVTFQGTKYTPAMVGNTPWASYRGQLGLIAASTTDTNIMLFMSRDSSLDADVASCISSGIIIVGAAGNYYMYNDIPTGSNYNNALHDITTDVPKYYMRGSSPTASNNVINVSWINNTVSEEKDQASNAGPRTDLFAPGGGIVSSYLTSGVADPRNASYYINTSSGTSMATPQVTGVLACALETYQSLNANAALNYLVANSTKNQLANVVSLPGSPFLNYTSLLWGPNRYIKYKKEREDSGVITPKNNYSLRTTGLTYPRRKIKRAG